MDVNIRNQVCMGDVQIDEELINGDWRITAEVCVRASGWANGTVIQLAKGKADVVGMMRYDLSKQVIWKIYGDIIRYLRMLSRDLDKEIGASGLSPSKKRGFSKVKKDLQDLTRQLEEGHSVMALWKRRIEEAKEDLRDS